MQSRWKYAKIQPNAVQAETYENSPKVQISEFWKIGTYVKQPTKEHFHDKFTDLFLKTFSGVKI